MSLAWNATLSPMILGQKYPESDSTKDIENEHFSV